MARSFSRTGWGTRALRRLGLGLTLLFALWPLAAAANDRAKLFATTENGFGRIIIDFPDRLDLPHYKIQSDNGVLAVVFDSPIDFTVPDIAAALPDYVNVARTDPDGRGIRFGLRTTFTVDHIEGGEQLYVDLLPTTWQGLPPSLPNAVIAGLAERAKQAALLAERKRKAEEAKTSHPTASVRVGRNPTFMRVEFQWNVDTEASFAVNGKAGNLDFDWPVPVDLYRVKTDLPAELSGVDNVVSADGSRVVFHTNGKVTPRFYAVSPRDFVVDIDTASTVPADPAAAATLKAIDAAKLATSAADAWWTPILGAMVSPWVQPALNTAPQASITPTIATLGSTVRITFPFDRDTPAAVFRRGDVVWMLFDTLTGIEQPASTPELAALAKTFSIVPSGDLQVVRLDVGGGRLATLGSEGKAWVLSLGDSLLGPTEPLTLSRRTDAAGLHEVVADLGQPAKVHQFHDPDVGDTLDVVTAYPPARGIVRNLDYVDFEALRSVHGLVVRPKHDDVTVALDKTLAVISAAGGLVVSPADAASDTIAAAAVPRTAFIDLGALKQDDPVKFNTRLDALSQGAAAADGGALDTARLDLARFYLANRFALEAVGVLEVMRKDLKTPALSDDLDLTLAAAEVVGDRAAEAMAILDEKPFADEIDGKVWRTLAEVDLGRFAAANEDAHDALAIISSYPAWVRTRFLLAATRSAIETGDAATADSIKTSIAFAELDPEQVSEYQLLGGRIAEAQGRANEALDAYGQVIAADIRPTRVEAVYRTIAALDKAGRLNIKKAIPTLAGESMLWRGDQLEADMDRLLADLYFKDGQYREGLATARSAVTAFPNGAGMDAVGQEAQHVFEDLYLNGGADKLQPVEALSLYYDFQALTPPGARGDEMIRNLAQRLVKVDLLSQAAKLLHYQIANRLKGAAQAQIAVQLAVIQIANRQPAEALKVLNMTELADLPPSLDRQRRLLEARALIDSNRTELALDVLTPLKGRDADRLRVEADWDSKNYEAVGNLLEVMYAPADASGPALSEAARLDVLRAAVAYALGSDQIGLSRLRSKFAGTLADTPEWPMFDYVTSAVAPASGPQFAAAAKAVASLDTLDAFLKSYKQVYGEDASMTPDEASAAVPQAATAAAPADGAG